MFNWLLALVFMSSFFSAYDYSYRLGGINQTFLLIGRGVIESTLSSFNDSLNDIYFIQDKVEESIIKYLSTELRPYCHKYEIGFYYFDPNSMGYCIDYCTGVQIHLRVPFILWSDYDRKMMFYLQENT